MATDLTKDKKGYAKEVYKAMSTEEKNLILSTACTLMGNFISHPSTASSIASASTRVLAAWGFRKRFLRIATDMLSDIGSIDFDTPRFKSAKNADGTLKTEDVDETTETT